MGLRLPALVFVAVLGATGAIAQSITPVPRRPIPPPARRPLLQRLLRRR